jgi:Mrp family chromosome partitioning ATPase
MEPIDYGGALRRSWRLLIGLAILGAVIAAFVPVGHAKRVKSALPYEALAIIGTAPNSNASPLNGGVSAPQLMFFAAKTDTKQGVADAAGLSIPDYELNSYMSATAVAASLVGAGAGPVKKNSAQVIELVGRGATPADAVLLANTYNTQLNEVVVEAVQKRQAFNPKSGIATNPSATPYTGIYTISDATTATKTGGPKAALGASRKVRVLGGLAIGAAIGAGIVLLRELLDKRLRNAARAEANFGFPVAVEVPAATVGAVPAVGALAPMVDVIRDPHSPGAEAYRMLRMSVMFESLAPLSGAADPYALGIDAGNGGMLPTGQRVETGPTQERPERHVVLVASAGSEPTRPHVAANLAAIYAEAGERVVVISTGELEARVNGVGTASVSGEIGIEDVRTRLEPSRLERVSRLPLHPFISRSGQLVTRMPAILEAARALSDVVIVEVPPLLAVHHAEALIPSVDVVLVVAECRLTTFDQARRAGDLLRRMAAPVLGVVLTNVRLDRADIRHSALAPLSVTQDATPQDRETVGAIGAGVGSTSGSATRA